MNCLSAVQGPQNVDRHISQADDGSIKRNSGHVLDLFGVLAGDFIVEDNGEPGEEDDLWGTKEEEEQDPEVDPRTGKKRKTQQQGGKGACLLSRHDSSWGVKQWASCCCW